MQTTILSPISFVGQGIHLGVETSMTLLPASQNFGIKFVRTDITDKNNVVEVSFDNFKNTPLNTSIVNADGVYIKTIEHLLAAVYAEDINNLEIRLDGPEIPILDGGSCQFCFGLAIAGKQIQSAKKRVVKILKNIEVKSDDGKSFAKVTPADEEVFNFEIDFPSQVIQKRKLSFNLTKSDFAAVISFAKTFANASEIEYLQKNNLGLGGNLQNTMVFDSDKIHNPYSCIDADDFVRHKILDLIGDVAVSGFRIIGSFECYKSGHALNNLLLKAIFADSSNFEIV